MNRSKKRLSLSRKAWSAVIAAGVLAASAAVVTTTSLAQNRPDRSSNGYDRRDRGNGGNRQSFDRSRFNNNNGGWAGNRPQQPASATQGPPSTSPASSQPSQSAAAATQESAAPPPPPPSQDLIRLRPSDYTTKYVLLEQKNIFLKTRQPPRDPARRDPRDEARAPRAPEELLVLRGIALQEGRRVAFVENLNNNTTSRLTPGSAILSGKIAEVGGDYIAYDDAGGRRTRIEIGHNFAGAVSSGGFGPQAGGGGGGDGSFTVSGSASASSGAAPPNPNDPNLTVEQRMKLKRLQEQQKPQ